MTRPDGGAWTGDVTPDAAVTYEIRVAGHLDDHWAVTLGDLDLVRHDDGTTSLTGPVLDQAQLHGLLARVRDLGAPLLTLRAAPDRSAAPAAASPRGNEVWGCAVRLGAGRVLRPGRWRRLRLTAWLDPLVLATALAFGLPLQRCSPWVRLLRKALPAPTDRAVVRQVETPTEHFRAAGLRRVDFTDTFVLRLPPGSTRDVEDWHRALVTVGSPAWVAVLVAVRNRVAQGLGLDTAGGSSDTSPFR